MYIKLLHKGKMLVDIKKFIKCTNGWHKEITFQTSAEM